MSHATRSDGALVVTDETGDKLMVSRADEDADDAPTGAIVVFDIFGNWVYASVSDAIAVRDYLTAKILAALSGKAGS